VLDAEGEILGCFVCDAPQGIFRRLNLNRQQRRASEDAFAGGTDTQDCEIGNTESIGLDLNPLLRDGDYASFRTMSDEDTSQEKLYE